MKGSIVSSAARQARIGRFEGSGSFSGLARVAGLTLKQPTVYFLAPLPQWIFSGRELIAWSNMMELSVYGTWSGLPNEIASELFSSATLYQLKAGDTLFQTGDKGDGCYRLDVGLLKDSDGTRPPTRSAESPRSAKSGHLSLGRTDGAAQRRADKSEQPD